MALLLSDQLVSLVTVLYYAAVTWLGPFDFTFWQLRAYQLSCVASIVFQFVFAGWCADLLAVRFAFPLAFSLALIYFAAFSATNVLILLEGDDSFPGLGFDTSTPLSQQERAMTHYAILHSKRARWH